MIRIKSFAEDRPSLYLVPTPIGNLEEMTSRALKILSTVDCIAAEDTRNTAKLLQVYGISKPLFSHHEHNQSVSIPKILSALKEGKKIAVVSDAGYPLVSDPGQQLVQRVIQEGYPVISVSGANAAMNALVASGLDCHHYFFYGFLDSKKSKRIKVLESLKEMPWTLLFYEAPHRIEAMLTDLLAVFGNRSMCLARELTKLHEEYIRGSVEEVLQVAGQCKGEMVVIVEGYRAPETIDWPVILEQVAVLSQKKRAKEAIKEVSQTYAVSKNEVYQRYLEYKKEGNE